MARALTIEVVGGRSEGEHQIRSAVAKWGYDWTEVECRLLDRTGRVVETFQWMPMPHQRYRGTGLWSAGVLPRRLGGL